ncbi:chemotaxis protein CheW [Meridianimarinicoccus roseus]|uniref:Chemotaxis protein CheW n=2 Tax=Meridianimarinicoccus roseus TaxID=2072018 RepID=A0A2V2LLU1_9RHOB|nr:chemotaxis protein CheW [Meridianimarinicoccus roseus]
MDPHLSVDESDNIDDMYLTFAVAGEDYGVTIGVVTEIVGMQRIMLVPDVPHFIKGVINLRGKVIPLMDVRLRFGIPEKEYDERTVVIVLDLGEAPIGLIVDAVSEVLEIPAENIDQASSFRSSDRQSVVRGLGRIGERVAILLDERVLVSDVDVAIPETLKA